MKQELAQEKQANPNDGRDRLNMIGDEDTPSLLSWTHGGEFLTGVTLVAFTTVGAAGVLVGGILADVGRNAGAASRGLRLHHM